jgi:hypothetical protein
MGFEIDKITIDASLSRGTSSPTEEYFVFMRHQNIKPKTRSELRLKPSKHRWVLTEVSFQNI